MLDADWWNCGTGARAQAETELGDDVDIDVDAETMARRQRHRLGASSPHCDVVSSVSSSANTSLLEQPEPRSRSVSFTLGPL